MAVTALRLPWTPGKGYHFPAGPYVEYAGSMEINEKEIIAKAMEDKCNDFIHEGRVTTLYFMDKEQMKSVCHFVPDYIPEGKPARVVMYGDFGIPCGGTHVSNLTELVHMTIRKIKLERGTIKVSYDVTR